MWEHFQPHQLRAKKSQMPKVPLGFTLHFNQRTWFPLLIKMKGDSIKHLSIRSNIKPLLYLVVSKQHRRCVTHWGWAKWGLSHLMSSFLKWPLGLWAHNQKRYFHSMDKQVPHILIKKQHPFPWLTHSPFSQATEHTHSHNLKLKNFTSWLCTRKLWWWCPHLTRWVWVYAHNMVMQNWLPPSLLKNNLREFFKEDWKTKISFACHFRLPAGF